MVEAKQTNIFATVEKFSYKESFEGGPKKLRIQGLALPFGKVSRNGVLYRKDSIIKNAESMKGKPLLFNHNAEQMPIGMVLEVKCEEDGMYYEAEVDENEQIIQNKIKNGYIQNVSIQCMIENPDFKEDGSVIVDVKEFLELSVVTIPGFAEATAQAIEKLKMVENKKPSKESVKTEQDGDGSTEFTLEDAKAAIESLMTRNSELEDRIAVIESRLDAEEETEEAEGEDEDEKSKDEEETQEEMDEEEDEEDKTPKEKLKRKAVPTASESSKATSIDMRAKRLENMGY